MIKTRAAADQLTTDPQAVAAELGIEESGAILATFQEKLSKWETIISEIGHDRDKYAEALWSEIESNVWSNKPS